MRKIFLDSEEPEQFSVDPDLPEGIRRVESMPHNNTRIVRPNSGRGIVPLPCCIRQGTLLSAR